MNTVRIIRGILVGIWIVTTSLDGNRLLMKSFQSSYTVWFWIFGSLGCTRRGVTTSQLFKGDDDHKVIKERVRAACVAVNETG